MVLLINALLKFHFLFLVLLWTPVTYKLFAYPFKLVITYSLSDKGSFFGPILSKKQFKKKNNYWLYTHERICTYNIVILTENYVKM